MRHSSVRGPRGAHDAAPARLTPYVVLIGALLLTVLATVVAHRSAIGDDAARFENRVQAATDRVDTRMEIYVALLRASAALFAAEDVSLQDWREFARRLDLPHRYPGILGIGYTRRVPADSLSWLVRRMRGEGHPGFQVYPDSARDEYHAIVYLEPLHERNAVAIGYDMFTNPVRREAMERARDRGTAALTGRVTLVQEISGDVQPGFLIYVPVYRNGGIPGTVEERRRLLNGFVYAPFRAGDLFKGIFGTERDPRVTFRVYDGATESPDSLLYDTDPGGAARDEGSSLVQRSGIAIAGHRWTLVFSPTEVFASASRATVPVIALAGVLVSLVLFWLTLAQNRARADAQRANRAKSQFLANMSHELRTPLNAIGGYVDLLDMGLRGPLSDAQRMDISRIKAAQQRLLGLINDVLNFAKLEAGRVEVRSRPVSLDASVRDVEALITPLAESRRVTYERSSRPDVMVLADPDKLQQILLNLLSNALKYTEPGGRASLEWEVREGQGQVAVRVTDTGIGIPADALEAIFEPFVQIDADLTRANQGSGLGLAISRELARAMDGELTATSQLGQGSEFTLVLRVAG